MAKQYGFYYDPGRCIQCHTCELACQNTRNIPLNIKWRRVIDKWLGIYPDVTHVSFSLACMHCEQPACLEVCPTGAITKRIEDGIVVVDRGKCNGCRDCLAACPYNIPQFDSEGIMQKCDFCLETGEEPVCVLHCPAEALHYGIINDSNELLGKSASRLGGLTKPSVIILGENYSDLTGNIS